MSTCSTATSAHRGGHESQRRRRRAPPAPAACDAGVVESVRGRLERRLVNLERDWDAYKTGQRPDAPRHRRSRSATGTPSSAVTVAEAAAAPDGLLLALHRCSSPRTLLSSLQQAGSADSGDDGCAAKIVLSGAAAGSPAAGSCQCGFSSVCSVEGGYSVAASSTSSCPSCRCAACCDGYSANSSSDTGATALSFSPAARGTIGEHARNKSGRGRSVASRVSWISAIVLIPVGLVAMVILELRVDEGCAEYLVPT